MARQRLVDDRDLRPLRTVGIRKTSATKHRNSESPKIIGRSGAKIGLRSHFVFRRRLPLDLKWAGIGPIDDVVRIERETRGNRRGHHPRLHLQLRQYFLGDFLALQAVVR